MNVIDALLLIARIRARKSDDGWVSVCDEIAAGIVEHEDQRVRKYLDTTYVRSVEKARSEVEQ